MKPWVVSTIFLSTLIALVGCSSVKVNGPSKSESFRLEVVEKIRPGQGSKNDISNLFGSPSRVEEGRTEVWHYDVDSRPRFSVTFDEANVVSSVVWLFSEADLDVDVLKVRNRYNKGNWEARASDSASPHYFPNECYLEDTSAGVSIEFKRSNKVATAISWWDASRKPSNTSEQRKKEKVPSCIGDKCTEYFRGDLDQLICGTDAK
jgi:outer membrane protein assembly factor BamE (lipoprotein component of BamABCDE complex)